MEPLQRSLMRRYKPRRMDLQGRSTFPGRDTHPNIRPPEAWSLHHQSLRSWKFG